METGSTIAAPLQSTIFTISSELGDKTFLCISVMAMKQDYLQIILSATAALWLTSFMSAVLGSLLSSLVRASILKAVGSVAFIIFGVASLWQSINSIIWSRSSHGAKNTDTELKDDFEGEAWKTSSISEDEEPKNLPHFGTAMGSNTLQAVVVKKPAASDDYDSAKFSEWIPTMFFSKQCFIMIFLAELGDRSQMGTMVLAATIDLVGVMAGAMLGHLICVCMAALAGRYVSNCMSEQTIGIVASVIMLCCGIGGLL